MAALLAFNFFGIYVLLTSKIDFSFEWHLNAVVASVRVVGM